MPCILSIILKCLKMCKYYVGCGEKVCYNEYVIFDGNGFRCGGFWNGYSSMEYGKINRKKCNVIDCNNGEVVYK